MVFDLGFHIYSLQFSKIKKGFSFEITITNDDIRRKSSIYLAQKEKRYTLKEKTTYFFFYQQKNSIHHYNQKVKPFEESNNK